MPDKINSHCPEHGCDVMGCADSCPFRVTTRICTLCGISTKGEDIHQCEMMPRYPVCTVGVRGGAGGNAYMNASPAKARLMIIRQQLEQMIADIDDIARRESRW